MGLTPPLAANIASNDPRDRPQPALWRSRFSSSLQDRTRRRSAPRTAPTSAGLTPSARRFIPKRIDPSIRMERACAEGWVGVAHATRNCALVTNSSQARPATKGWGTPRRSHKAASPDQAQQPSCLTIAPRRLSCPHPPSRQMVALQRSSTVGWHASPIVPRRQR